MYLVMVDRFADGAPNVQPVSPADPHGWHGGDIQGLRDHLDHLAALGVRTVWLTPITDSRDTKVGEWGAFHGYWLRDPWTMQPRFGTVDDLRALSDDLHARGMRLVVDMVWNHTDYDAPVREAHPDWFHDLGDIQDWNDPYQRVNGDVHGLPDLAQERPEVAAYLRDSARFWVLRGGIDGLRIDAVGHMPVSFLADMNQYLDGVAQQAGSPSGVWTLAEDFTGDPLALSNTVENAGFDAIFDFAAHYALVDVACRQHDPRRLAATLSLDRLGPPDAARVTFLDNHDLPRVAHVCGETAASPEETQARVDAALVLLFALRGTPCLTWGTEAGLDGGEEPSNRADMPWDRVDHRSGWISQLAARRAAHSALSKGESRLVWARAEGVRWLRFSDEEVAVIDVGDVSAPLPGLLSVDDAWGIAADPSAPAVDAPSGDWTGEGVSGTRVRVVTGRPQGASWATWREAALTPHTLTLEVSGAPVEGDVRVVGAHPAMGAWNPHQGLRTVRTEDGRHRAQVALLDGDVAAFKVVVVAPDGSVTWDAGPDQWAFLAPGRDATVQAVAWTGP